MTYNDVHDMMNITNLEKIREIEKNINVACSPFIIIMSYIVSFISSLSSTFFKLIINYYFKALASHFIRRGYQELQDRDKARPHAAILAAIWSCDARDGNIAGERMQHVKTCGHFSAAIQPVRWSAKSCDEVRFEVQHVELFGCELSRDGTFSSRLRCIAACGRGVGGAAMRLGWHGNAPGRSANRRAPRVHVTSGHVVTGLVVPLCSRQFPPAVFYLAR